MKNYHCVKNKNGTYDVKFNSTLLCTESTVKNAKKKVQEYKRKVKHYNVCSKIFAYGEHLKVMVK